MDKTLDYRNLGLKVGLEIHQEVDTNKLFCKCPSKLQDGESEIKVERELRPTESELGEIDQAALAEAEKNKRFRYHVYKQSNCLVELDEEPPHPLNEEAIDIAIQCSLLLNATPVDEAHVMRKTVIDGSNTTGFQRTVLFATEGKIKINNREISIPTICLEEDAARKAQEREEIVEYKLDRLGIPLLEIATGPDFNDPKDAADGALKIGQILRTTGKMKRGIGTIRQDVNVSIENGARQEIKGVQELELIETVIKREVQRQIGLLEIKEKLEKRGAEKSEKKVYSVTDVFSDTKSSIIKNSLSNGGVYAAKLKKFSELLGKNLLPERGFGTELSEYAGVYGGVKGIFHTDELPGYGISESEVRELRKVVNADKEDAVVIIADTADKATKGLEAVIDRANKAFEGVPKETRAALPNGNTQYLRPLPGAARMYVETDVPPSKITQSRTKKIKDNLPEKPEEKRKKYKEKIGLSDELSKQMSMSDKFALFEEIIEEHDVDPTLVASTLLQKFKQLENEGININKISEKDLKKIFGLISEGKISKDSLSKLLTEIGRGSEVKEAIESLGIEKMDEGEIDKVISSIVEEKEKLIEEEGERSVNALMGIAMGRLKGKADGELVHKLLRNKVMEKLEN
ncbi:MAG: Glu-tRNA(Gln) amidotransferase subunit GatE [Candidatus Hadarchaeota archaeon]